MPFSSNQLQYASNSPSFGPDTTHDSLNTTAGESQTDRQGRIVQPQSLKNPSLLSNIRRTWTATTESATNHGQVQGQPTRNCREGNAKIAPKSELSGAELRVEEDDRFVNEDKREGVDRATEEPVPKMGDKVLWAKWDSLEQGEGESRRVLVIAYKSGAFAIWDCSNLDSWFELLSLRSLESALEPSSSKRYTRGIGSIIDSVILPSGSTRSAEPTIAILTRRPNSSSSHVFLYSLLSHRINSSLEIAGTGHRVAANRRFLFVSTISPLAIHVFSLPSFQPTPFSPITDLVPSPFDGSPVFSVGNGGRLLAYATDRPIHSSRLDRSPAKPGAGLLAHSGLFDTEVNPIAGSSDFFGCSQGGGGTMMSEAGQVGGEVARKVSEGVLSGVKAIGEVGMSYWMTRSTNGRSQQSSTTSSESKFSKSAPVNTVAGFGRRLSVSNALSASSSRPSSAGSTSPDSAYSAVAGTVIVVDLLSSSARQSRSNRPLSSSSLKTIAHSRPYSQSLALLSFSPSSTSILTASTPSHAFDIFELHPSSPVGASALYSVPTSSDSNSGKVWHRYRLQRGYTSARATSASWSNDGRFVAVGTGKGTSHVYAIQPMGGQPILENHFDPKVSNLDELPSLSITLSTIARVRPSSSSTMEDHFYLSSAFPSFTFVPKPDSFASSFRPDQPSSSRGSSFRSSAGKFAPIQDLLVFHPSQSSAHLHRFSVTDSLPSPSSAVAAASRGEVGRLATTAVSGLTQLMKSRGGFGGNGSSGAAGYGGAGEVKREWIVSCSAKAEWKLTREESEDDVVERVTASGERSAKSSKKAGGLRYSAFAEIETFSRSPRVLPRSIYQSQQFDFFALPADHLNSTSLGDYSLRGARLLEMRSRVLVRQGESTISNDFAPSSSSPIPFEPASFDQPIKTAMQTVLDQEAILSPGSPKLPAPSFPVGIPGKQGSWRDSIPIRSVGPAAIEGFGRVRQGLGRVKLPNAGEIVDAARRRSSAAASYIHSNQAYSSSISFEDEDAVFADRLAGEEMGSASTACTSEGDEGRLSKEEKEEESRDAVDEWGWDEATEDLAQALKSSPLSTNDILNQPPFDDDFDNFELELSAPPPPTVKPFSPPSLEPEIVTSIPSTAIRAPPVNLTPMQDVSPESSPSRHPSNPLLEILKPATTSLSSSPASVLSNTSSIGGGGGKKKKRK